MVSDLYLGDPNRALKAFEQYKSLSGEDKPVSGWIAELRATAGVDAGEAASRRIRARRGGLDSRRAGRRAALQQGRAGRERPGGEARAAAAGCESGEGRRRGE